ncbi:ectoine/hydroxyectoine ABC transporter substrate-binding protein EhuB [Mesorhizobium sp. M0590]|uniref:ectoine/hydroxyectoine ABC transporter substrate-binding protein EhuB n=1 Tax=Mesorhizobium sp. M0590 TaxID=2956966 RepID=UPI0033395FE7
MNKWQGVECKSNLFRRVVLKGIVVLGITAMAIGSFAVSASATSLLEKIKNGEAIRIGYSDDPPWAYSGGNNEPLGISNTILLAVLKKMGATKIEPVVTEWGSLIPGLQAGRYDVISDAMYVLPERCRNVLFTDPINVGVNSMVVPRGNPKGLHSMEDVRDKGLTLVTGSGFASLKSARDVGIPDDKLMQVPGYPEILQAVKAGRADAGAGDYLTLKKAVNNDESLHLASPYTESGKQNYSAFALPLNDQAAVDAINAVMEGYIGSDEMLASVSTYGYDKLLLPNGRTTAELCKG